MTFNHEKLNVYQRSLTFNAKVSTWTDQWDSKHAVRDQLSRAAGSILENTAMASAAFSSFKQRSIDYAIGSALECAGCLDLAGIKGFVDESIVQAEKRELSQIVRMLVGLKKSWERQDQVMREDRAEYATENSRDDILFHHETLDVYRASLDAAKAIYSSAGFNNLPNPEFRRLDELLTSIVLNIAEGNGRFARTDQARFIRTAHESAVKLAARLDLCVARGFLSNEVRDWKELLERVAAMTRGMCKSFQNK
jgi:four helix bundle protein